jgi:outer membrane lipoprotein-sorting protein
MFRKSLFAFALVALSAATASAQTVDEIVAKHLEARGGAAKLKAVNSIRITGKRELQPGLEVPMVVEMKRPNLQHVEFTLQGMTAVLAYDGKTGWQIMPFQGKKDPETMGEDETKDFAEDDIDGVFVDYKSKGNTVELIGKEKLEGTDAYKLKVTKKSGTVETIYIDADSFLEIKGSTKRTVRGAEQQIDQTVGDYKEVGGIMFPHSFEFSAAGQPKLKMTIEKIELNPALDDARFKMPAVKKAEGNAPAAKPESKESETKPADKKPEPNKKPPVG